MILTWAARRKLILEPTFIVVTFSYSPVLYMNSVVSFTTDSVASGMGSAAWKI